jgi:hypothetical protein
MRPDLDPRLLERLRDLPDEAAPFDYAEFAQRRARRRVQQTQRPLRLLAAALAVLLAGWVFRHGLAPLVGDDFPVADAPLPPLAPPGIAPEAHWPALLPTVDAQSWLDSHPPRALVRVPAQMAVTELEDQIATLDDQLNAERLSHPHAQQLALLQRDRAQMVESLAQVRYAQNMVAGLP